MENLWAAWRRDFILGPKENGCVFCKRLKQHTDRDNLILFRARKTFVIMNRYPYNGGHLLIAPKAHKADIQKLTPSESAEMFELSRIAIGMLKKIMPADGFNLGMNLGEIAGAGIADHLHVHVVPRFNGDTNFMPVVGDTKVQSLSLYDIYDMLKPKFDSIRGKF